MLTDIRYSVRSLARNLGFAFALLVSIALGLGANVTVLCFIRGLGARSSPVSPDSRLVSLFAPDRYRGPAPFSYDEYLSLKARDNVFEWSGAAQVSQTAIELNGRSVIATVASVTPEVAALFHLSLEDGVLLGHRFWQNELGKSALEGKHLLAAGTAANLAGIAPESLDGVYDGRQVDVWRLLRDEPPDRTLRNLWPIARLRSETSVTALAASGKVIVVPYTGMTPDMSKAIGGMGVLLRFATVLVFFVACVNVTSFLLGRAASRSHANSIRVTLGVSRSRLVLSVLTDSIVVATAGGAIGALLALWTSKVIPALLFERDAGFLILSPSISTIMAASASGVAILIFCGFFPLLQIRNDQAALVLRREAAGPSRSSRTIRAVLLIAQTAGCCLLIIGAGVLYASFRASLHTTLGAGYTNPVLAILNVHPGVNVDIQYFRDIERATRSLPRIDDFAWTAAVPGSQPAVRSFRIEPNGLPRREVQLNVAPFTSRSVAQFQWPPKSGRSFGLADSGCRVAVVNTEAATFLFGDDTVGRVIYDPAGMPVEIIGVLSPRAVSHASLYFNQAEVPSTPVGRSELKRFTAQRLAKLERAELNINVVSANYFAAMGFRLVTGRLSPDPRARACRVAVVNEEAADQFFSGHAVGAALIDELGQRTEIIGVVHAHQLGPFARRAEPTVFFPMAQDCAPTMTLMMAARETGAPMLRKVLRALDRVPGRGPAPVVVRTLETHLRQTALAPQHIATVLIAACTAIALSLSVLGLYGALSDAARIRRRDLAIRIALGARRRDVIRHVLQEGAYITTAGTIAGSLGAFVLTRLLPVTTPLNPSLWLAGPVLLTAAMIIAGVLPARRALVLDPIRILRGD